MFSIKESPPGVSIIICSYNGADRIGETLGHLHLQNAGKEIEWEVILVDNGSTDGTSEVVRVKWNSLVPLKIIHEPRQGLTHARTTGLEHAKYEYVSFIDDDNWVATNWVTEVYNIFYNNSQIVICGGRNEAVYECTPPNWFESVKACYAIGTQGEGTSDITDVRKFLWGAGMSFRRSCFTKLLSAGFKFHSSDQSGALMRGDDTELSMAFVAAGYRLWYVDTLTMKHYMPAGRMSWKYAEGLFSGLGEFEFLLDLYRQAYLGSRFPLVKIYGSLIGYCFLYFGWRLFAFKNQEGNVRYLSYIARKSYIFTAFRQVSRVADRIRQIRDFCQKARTINV